VTSTETHSSWRDFLDGFPEAHILQSDDWGTLKSNHGWSCERVQHGGSGAQILFRTLLPGLTLAYIPKGPVGANLCVTLPHVIDVCRKRHAFVLKIEPDTWAGDPLEQKLLDAGFHPSPQTVQPPRTIMVDLTGSEDDILGRMKQKTRYNIRLAARKGIEVKPWDDIAGFGRMMDITADRNEFGTHITRYYQDAYDLFHPGGACELLMASYEDQPLAALMVFLRGSRAWYMYGASTNLHRNRMPAYLLQWEAMRWAMQRGCTQYDLWGVPDEDEATLEASFTTRHEGLWGVYRFKRGFGGALMRSSGAFDLSLQPFLYRLYQAAIKVRAR